MHFVGIEFNNDTKRWPGSGGVAEPAVAWVDKDPATVRAGTCKVLFGPPRD